MNEKRDRNQRLYQHHLRNPLMSYAKIGRVFRHKFKGKMKSLDASAVYRIIKREERRLEIDSKESGKEKG